MAGKKFDFSKTLIHHLDHTAKIARILGVRYFDEHKEYDITYNNFLIIEIIYSNPNIHQRDLSKLILMGTSNLSRELERLENKKLITRTLTEKDKKRVKLLNLTPLGKEVYKKIESAWESYITNLESIYTSQELKTFTELLLKMKSKLTESTDIILD